MNVRIAIALATVLACRVVASDGMGTIADARARFLAGDTTVVADLAAACDPRARFAPDEAWPRTACVLLDAFASDDLPTWRTRAEIEIALADPVPDVRTLAVRHLAPLGIHLNDEQLRTLLGDPSPTVVAAALEARIDLGDRGVGDAASGLLHHPDSTVRLAAADALLDPADPRSVLGVLPVVDDPDPAVRSGVRTCVDALGLLAPMIRARLDQGATSDDPHERAAAWRAVTFMLAGSPVPDDQTDRLVRAGDDPSGEVRVEAALAALPSVRGRTSMIGESSTSDETERTVRPWPVPAPTVACVLADSDPDRRRAAVELTTWLPDDRAVTVVRERFEYGESDEDVAAALLDRMSAIGDARDLAPVIAFGRGSASARVQAAAVLAAARLDGGRADPRIVEWIRELLGDDEDSQGRLAAAGDAARVVGDPDLIPDVAAALRRCPIERPWVCTSLSGAISGLLGRRIHGGAFVLERHP